MTILPLLLSLLTVPVSVDASMYVSLATAIEAQERPALWHAIHEVECSGLTICGRSHSGACCPLQVLGGRYGNPPCALLEASPWLCVVSADRQMERCRRMCGRSRAVGCYHTGGCGGSPEYERRVNAAVVAAQRRGE